MFTVLVCRACCCGTAKHPGFDHDAQIDRISAAIAGQPGARVRIVGCLDVCSRSNVIVVRDRRPESDPNRRATWLGRIVDDASTDALCAWLADGGPASSLPSSLVAHRFDGPHRDVPRDLREEDADQPRRLLPLHVAGGGAT